MRSSMHSDTPANKPDAVSPAMALRFAIEDQRRRVTDLARSVSILISGI